MGEQLERDTTVLFAQVLGGAGVTTLQACMAQLRKTAEDCGARALDSGNDRLMVLLATPDAAADAAAAMLTSMDRVPQYGGARLGLGIGFHHGPAIQKEDQVYGDTVNLAAQLVAKAANGQIITTRETASHFSPIYRAWMRKLGSIEIKGRSGEVGLCELMWRADDNATVFAKRRVETRQGNVMLTLAYRGQAHVRRRERDAITIGRGDTAGIQIKDDQASRLHCTIERRQDKFVLTDHSTNGTYVKINSAPEVLVQREEFALTGKGTIACGQPAVSTKEIVQFELGA
ncbi:MAG TPA: FHA domain-containing protein, partial [Burkholderiales bacterium]|nr:FHA domain-containing protein [Burkholderiales bacterium]